MRVHISWPILIAVLAAGLLAILIYERSWIPAYAEAEPLYPTVAEFGRALVDANAENPVAKSSEKELLLEDRFKAIRPYGVVYSADKETLVSIRVNHRFSFDIALDGTPRWNRK